jgi:iron complex outermembrane recepter protein
MRGAILKSTCAVAALLTGASAIAQTATPAPAASEAAQNGVADIIVTAQRRSESVQDVPIAISAFSSAQLESQGVSNTLQLGQYVPNLVAQNNTGLGSANAYFLRGLGNTETIATFDPPVGTYVDDIYISRQNANNLSLFDVERVEVLRGPQGTLFGRNTTGGAINVIMKKPGETVSGYAEIGYGSYSKKLIRGSIDLPLAPTLAIKLSGYWQDDNGYVRNVTTNERMNDDDGWGARAAVRGDLAPDIRWNASYAHIVANGENTLNFDCNPVTPTQCNGRFATGGLKNGNTLSPSPFQPLFNAILQPATISGRKANYGQGNRAESDLITSTLEGDIAEKTIISLITGYIGLRQQFAIDFFDGRGSPGISTPVPTVRGFSSGGFTILNDGYHSQFSQEVKINGQVRDGLITYVAGGYYLDEYNRTDFADVLTTATIIIPPFTFVPGGQRTLLGDRTLTNKTRALAGYVQGDLNIGPVTLTAGIRYTDERKTFDIRDNRALCNLGGTLPATCLGNANMIAPSGVRIPTVQRAKLWTPRFAVNFKPTEDILLFASATRGFKSGGWNARGTVNNQLLPFGPEKVWSYEAGIKSDLFDKKVRANLTFFYMDVTDLQTPSALVNPTTGAITFLTRNFANYRNKGIEGEFIFQPVTGLNLFANFGYQDDKYILPANAPAVDIYGIQSVAAQAAACRALVAAGNIPGGTGTAACAAGIVDPRGNISTPVRTPEWTIALGGSYKAPLGGGLTLTPSINASYRGRQEVGTSNLTIYTGSVTGTNGTYPANLLGGTEIVGSLSKAAWLFNAGLALKGQDDRWTLSAECTNCFNKDYIQSTLANYSYLNHPVEWMIRAKYNF